MRNRIIICVILAIGIMAIRYRQVNNPLYTLDRIIESIETHNWKLFEKNVDINTLYTMASSDDDIKKMTEEEFKSKLQIEIEDSDNHESIGYLSQLYSLFKSNKGVDVIDKGKVSIVKLNSEFGEFNIPAYLQLSLRSVGFKYVLIDINRENIIERLAVIDKVYKKYYYKPLEDIIHASINMNVNKVYKSCSNYILKRCFDDILMIEIDIENISKKKILEVEYTLYPDKYSQNSLYAKYGIEKNIESGEIIKVGREKGWTFNKFDNREKKWLIVDVDSVIIKPTKITFSDSEVVNLDEYEYLLNSKKPKLKELIEFAEKESVDEFKYLKEWMRPNRR